MPDKADAPATAPAAADWTVQATDAIVTAVGKVEKKVAGPFTTAARGIVFGLFILILGVASVIVFTIMMVRLLNNYLPDAYFGEDHVWVAYTIVGLIFLAIGRFVAWPRRKPKLTH
jgi:Mn2+/Fe2+ NRAMP family transporter